MRTTSLRALARRTALAAAAATTATVLTPSAASALIADQSPRDDRSILEAAERREQRREERRAAAEAASRGDQVLDLADNEAGDPYVYGAAGPDSFDCSGFTQYVFAQLGVSLPHSSSAQAAMATPVSAPQVGDLVFFGGSGGVYHVGIYAGDGMLWHSPRSGDVVSLDPIWTSSGVFYGRV